MDIISLIQTTKRMTKDMPARSNRQEHFLSVRGRVRVRRPGRTVSGQPVSPPAHLAQLALQITVL